MKVLLAHNFYRSSAPSGEDAVYRNEKLILEKRVDVVTFERYNDDIDDSTLSRKIKLAVDGGWSKKTYDELTQILLKERPDVAHFHNTFPQISPSAFAACQDNGVPVVQTLHNFRFICPGALLLREGLPCEECLTGRSLLPALRHRCYRNSILATGAQVWTIASNRWRGTYKNSVNRYISLTSFAAEKFILGGLPKERIEVKPNFLPEIPEEGRGQGEYIVYVGRLSEEKGVDTLIEAWKNLPDLRLKILGDGPLRSDLENQVKQFNLPVEFLGFCSKKTIIETVSQAICQIIPSICYEGFPLVALEAYACGTPLIVSRIGSLNEIVKEGETGFKFEPGNAKALGSSIKQLMSDIERLRKMRIKSRALFLSNYTAEKNVQQLLSIYEDAMLEFRNKAFNKFVES